MHLVLRLQPPAVVFLIGMTLLCLLFKRMLNLSNDDDDDDDDDDDAKLGNLGSNQSQSLNHIDL